MVGVVAVVAGPLGLRVALGFPVFPAVRPVSSFFDIYKKISSTVSIQALVKK